MRGEFHSHVTTVYVTVILQTYISEDFEDVTIY
jgi:hypothetical protein